MKKITIKIGGEAGFGIMSAGTMLTKAFVRHGYHAIAGNEYPSLIRGGHNLITVGLSTTPFYALDTSIDILVALNKETVDLHGKELTHKAIVVYDPKDVTVNTADFSKDITFIALPLSEIVSSLGGVSVMRNTVAIGAVVALLGVDFSYLSEVVTDQFLKKGDKVIKENIDVAKAGFDAVKKEHAAVTGMFLDAPETKDEHYIMNASEAVGLGALDGGMKFAAIYPMTPINALISLFADHSKELGIVYKQPEDEIAGIMMAIGASLAGVRSMVATSGGGFALMVEGVSMTGIMEVPLVIDLGMRPGPATGMPTWTEQGELQMVLHAGHGEFPRIVLAPGDVEEAYTLTKQAFDLAEMYQIPVFVLTDKYINENQWCVKKSVFTNPKAVERKNMATTPLPSDESFNRYALDTVTGTSPRSLPGMEFGRYLANSYEHDEKGLTTEESAMRIAMATKRMKKLETILKVAPLPQIYGDANAEITLVGWGSTKGPMLEAIPLLQAQGKKVKCIHFSWIYPMDEKKIQAILGKEKRLVIIEGNSTAQFAGLLRECTGIDIQEKLLKFDGRQWFPEEIVEKIG